MSNDIFGQMTILSIDEIQQQTQKKTQKTKKRKANTFVDEKQRKQKNNRSFF